MYVLKSTFSGFSSASSCLTFSYLELCTLHHYGNILKKFPLLLVRFCFVIVSQNLYFSALNKGLQGSLLATL